MTRQLLVVTLFLFLGYGSFKVFPLIAGPSLSITSPVDFSTIESGIVLIEGQASRVATLTLNDYPLLRDKEGRFSTVRTLPRGGSILTLVATDRFGKSVSEMRTVYIP